MTLSILDKLTIYTSTANAKSELLIDIARNLEQDFSIPAIAADFKNFGTPLEKVAGRQMYLSINKARPTYTSFDGIISPLALQTLQTGEGTERLADAFYKASEAINSSEALLSGLVICYIKPILKMLATMIVLGAIGDTVFEQLKSILPMVRWPSLATSFYHLSGFFYSNWHWLCIGLLILFTSAYAVLTNVTGSARKIIDTLPFYRHYRTLTASLVLAQLSTLINAGKPMLESINWLAEQQNRYGRWHLKQMSRNVIEVRGSGNFGKIIDTGLVNDREVGRLQRSIPENQIGDRLLNASENHKILLKRTVDRLTKITSVMTLTFMFMMLFWFFVGVFFLILSIQ